MVFKGYAFSKGLFLFVKDVG